ncbi:DNA damage-inducible protein 1 [Monosporozyma servazzii]
MNLTISNEITEQIYGPIEVSDDMKLEDLIALLEAEFQFNESMNDIYFNMDIIDLFKSKDKTLAELGMKDDDLLLIRNKIQAVTADTLSDRDYVEEVRKQLSTDQPMRQRLRSQIPDLENMINNPDLFYERMGPVLLQRRSSNSQSLNPFGIPQDEYNTLMSNPDDPKNKKRIAELTDQQAIDEQLRNAYEYTPEVFTTVSMLYISVEINGHPVKAFVDTGAQMTIMSTRLAESTGLTKLIDKRFVGEARGVGRGKIIGRIHQTQMKIETQYISSSFVVLDTDIDLLIGLDMLKRHQATIELAKNSLSIAGIETKFLSEAEIPKGIEDEVIQTTSKNTISIGSNGQHPPQQQSVPITLPRTNMNTPIRNTVPPQQSPKFSESSIKQLMDLGFSRDEVLRALKASNGNEEYAAAYLFQ